MDILKMFLWGEGRAYRLAPIFSSGHPVHETGEALHTKVALVLSSRTDRNGVPRNIFEKFICIRVRRSDELPAQRHSHFIIDLIGINAFGWLPDNNLPTNPACEVESGQVGIDFLLRKSIRFPMEIHQPQSIFEVAETSLQPPA